MTPTGAAALLGYTTRAHVKAQLGDLVQGDSSADAVLDALILAASRAIDSYCGRVFGREAVEEDVAGDGSVWLMLERTPVVAVTEVLYDSSPVLDYTNEDPEAGLLYRRLGFYDTRGASWFLGEIRPPNQEQHLYHVEYVGGYLLPAEDVTAKTLSVVAADQTYRDSAGGFPLLVAGDRIQASGFTTAANNGWKTVVSATASQIIVTSTPLLENEAVPDATGAARSLRVQTLPADLEQACIEIVKSYWIGRNRDRDVVTERVGDLEVRYAGRFPQQERPEALPFTAIGLLAAYQRAI